MLANTIFEGAVEQIIDVAARFTGLLEKAGIPCRVVGGLASYLHVHQVDPLLARLTRDVDVAIDRARLEAVRAAVEPYGFLYRHAAGVDMFLLAENPDARSGVHLIFVGEKFRSEDLESIPSSPPVRAQRGILIAPVADLVRMKLTSFRLKDKVHIQDLDGVGLITPEIEQNLSETLRQRLAEVRATE
jgi:hypothetical protein